MNNYALSANALLPLITIREGRPMISTMAMDMSSTVPALLEFLNYAGALFLRYISTNNVGQVG